MADGISTPSTRSGPSASAASAATTAESIPPESPRITSRKPHLADVVAQPQDQGAPGASPCPARYPGEPRRSGRRYPGRPGPRQSVRPGPPRRPVGVNRETAAVEDEFVVSAHLVDVDQPTRDVPQGRREAMLRRVSSLWSEKGDAERLTRKSIRSPRSRSSGSVAVEPPVGDVGVVPDVLADGHPEAAPAALEDRSGRCPARSGAPRRRRRRSAGGTCGTPRPAARRPAAPAAL